MFPIVPPSSKGISPEQRANALKAIEHEAKKRYAAYRASGGTLGIRLFVPLSVLFVAGLLEADHLRHTGHAVRMFVRMDDGQLVTIEDNPHSTSEFNTGWQTGSEFPIKLAGGVA